MSIDWAKIAADHWKTQPSPHNPNLTNGDYSTAVKLATMTKFGQGEGHASAKEAELFWHEFKATGLSPKQYEEALTRMAPVSFALHGRPPSMDEIVRLKDEHPEAVSKYYGALPDRHYPHVAAGDMVKALVSSHPAAMQALGRPPNKLEASVIHHGRYNPETFYSSLKPQTEGNVNDTQSPATVPDAGSGGVLPGGDDRRGR